MYIIRKFLPTVIIFMLGLALGIGGVIGFQFVKGPKQTVSVTGDATVEALADQASVSIHIENTAWNMTTAQDATKKAVSDVKGALLSLGIPESQIQENSYDSTPVQPVAISVNNSLSIPQPITGGSGYSSSADLNITLTSLMGIEKVLTVVDVNKSAKIGYTTYFLKGETKFKNQAREKALQNARDQVDAIAKINKLSVGKLVSITDANTYPGGIDLMKGVTSGSAPQSSSAQISYGEKTIPVTASFNAVYELY